MKDTKRSILKRLLTGQISATRAALELQDATGGKPVTLVIRGTDGYSIGLESGLSDEEMKARVKGRLHVIVDESSALLAGAGPVLIPGNNTVFLLPDNGR